MFAFLRVAALVLVSASLAWGRGLYPDAPLVRRANAWKPCRPIPGELLRFHDRNNPYPLAADSAPSAADSISVFLSIDNYPLFLEIVFATRDPYIRDLATGQALAVGGPNRFFGDLRARLRAHPERRAEPPFAALMARAGRRQVVVEEMYADDKDMAPRAADAAFTRAAADLHAGMDFEKASTKCQGEHPAANGWQSLVAVAGQKIFVEPAAGEPRAATPPIPAGHLRELLAARAGDVFVAHDRKARQTFLYRVKEVYAGTDAGGR